MNRRATTSCLIALTWAGVLWSGVSAQARDCSAEFIELKSQVAVDNFQANFGAGGICDRVAGSLVIEEDPANQIVSFHPITNLDGLSDLVSVTGSLAIRGNPDLARIDGLAGLNSVGGSLSISGNSKLTEIDSLLALSTVGLGLSIADNTALDNVDGLLGLSSLPGGLGIVNNAALKNLDGLANASGALTSLTIAENPSLVQVDSLAGITSVSEYLSVIGNASLAQLDGLSNITGPVEYAWVYENASLAKIDGLAGISEVNRSLEIRDNPSLGDLDGLAGLTRVGLDLAVWKNASLASVEGLSGLTTVGRHFTLAYSPALASLDGLEALAEVGGIMTLSVNPLLTDLRGLSSLAQVGRELHIGANKALSSLEGLASLATVGHLRIDVNAALARLDGLEQLRSIQSLRVDANPVLTSLAGLANVSSGVSAIEITKNSALTQLGDLKLISAATQRLIIRDNPVLVSLDGLSGLSGQVERLYIENNAALRSVQALSGITSVTQGLDIRGNASLENLDGLSGIQQVWGGVFISFNESLTNLDGLSGLKQVYGHQIIIGPPFPFPGGNLQVMDNPQLTDCTGLKLVLGFPTVPHDGSQDGVDGDEVTIADSNGLGARSPDDCLRTNTGPIVPILPDIRVAITGSWYDPDSSGQGLMMHATPNDTVAMYFYGFDESGARQWFLSIAQGPFAWNEPIQFTTYLAQGGSFTTMDEDTVTVSPWGTSEITLADCSSGLLEMSGATGDKTLVLQRLGSVAGSACSAGEIPDESESTTGSWYDPATSGQGFSIHKISGSRGVVYFYGFEDSGSELWLSGNWEEGMPFGQTVAIPLQQVSGGTFDHVDPEQVLREDWGTLFLQFDDCTSGTAVLDGIHGSQQLDIQLLAGSFGLDCDSGAPN